MGIDQDLELLGPGPESDLFGEPAAPLDVGGTHVRANEDVPRLTFCAADPVDLDDV